VIRAELKTSGDRISMSDSGDLPSIEKHTRRDGRLPGVISGVTQAGVNIGVRIGPRDTRESCALETPPGLSPQRLVGDQGGRNWQVESKLRFMKKELFR